MFSLPSRTPALSTLMRNARVIWQAVLPVSGPSPSRVGPPLRAAPALAPCQLAPYQPTLPVSACCLRTLQRLELPVGNCSQDFMQSFILGKAEEHRGLPDARDCLLCLLILVLALRSRFKRPPLHGPTATV